MITDILQNNICYSTKKAENSFFASYITKQNRLLILLFILLSCVLFINLIPHSAYAADTDKTICTMVKDGTGTYVNNPEFDLQDITIISSIISSIRLRLSNFSLAIMYSTITADLGFIAALHGALVLFIAIYGILFMTGMIQLKTYDFMIRIIKFGIVAELLSPTSWIFFNDYVVNFFNSGTDDIISFLTGSDGFFKDIIGDFVKDDGPFAALDIIVTKIASPRMFVTILATFLTDNYGWVYGLLLLYAVWVLLKCVMTALWVYIMALVMKTLLFGLAPIFIPTILFQRTRHIFDGWLNQIISASLQPILLFMFFIFFIKLMEGSLDNIMHTPLCFSSYPEGWRGSGFDFSYWRFMEYTTDGWKPKSDGWKLETFPINLMAILSFLIIADLANRFNSVVMQIAAQLSQVTTSLLGVDGPISAMAGSARSVFSGSGIFGGNVGRNIAATRD